MSMALWLSSFMPIHQILPGYIIPLKRNNLLFRYLGQLCVLEQSSCSLSPDWPKIIAMVSALLLAKTGLERACDNQEVHDRTSWTGFSTEGRWGTFPSSRSCRVCVDHFLLPAANTLLAATAMIGNNLLTPAQSNSSEALSQLSSVTLP